MLIVEELKLEDLALDTVACVARNNWQNRKKTLAVPKKHVGRYQY